MRFATLATFKQKGKLFEGTCKIPFHPYFYYFIPSRERNMVRHRKWREEKTEKTVTPLPPSDPVSTGMVFVFWFFKFKVKHDLGLGILVRLD